MWAGTPEYTASCGDLLIGPRPGLSNCRIIVLLVLFTPESLHKASDPRIPGGGRFDKSSNALLYSLIWRCTGQKWTKDDASASGGTACLAGELELAMHKKWCRVDCIHTAAAPEKPSYLDNSSETTATRHVGLRPTIRPTLDSRREPKRRKGTSTKPRSVRSMPARTVRSGNPSPPSLVQNRCS